MSHASTAPSDWVFDVTTQDFDQRVLVASHQQPIVVDFWAEWCGPCRALGPVLEKAVSALGGRVLLAKVNTDRSQDLAQRYRISGIPAVKAFHNGELVKEFVGAKDLRFVTEFFSSLAPSPAAKLLEQAAVAYLAGATDEARAHLLPLSTDGFAALSEERRAQARVLLAQVQLFSGAFAEIDPLLAPLDERSAEFDRAEIIRQVRAIFESVPDPAGEILVPSEDEPDPDLHYTAAIRLARRRSIAPAFEQLLWLIANRRKYRDDDAKKALLALFQLLGDHQDVYDARRRLQVLT
jgi:putative thioredoxin